MTTDRIMLDVLRSTSTTHGKLCVKLTLTTERHKSPVLCSDLGEFVFVSIVLNVTHILSPPHTHIVCT